MVKDTEQDWYIFDEKNENVINGVTAVTPVTVFMFSGHNRLPSDFLMEAKPGKIKCIYDLKFHQILIL